jgi:hypothetical protein
VTAPAAGVGCKRMVRPIVADQLRHDRLSESDGTNYSYPSNFPEEFTLLHCAKSNALVGSLLTENKSVFWPS